mmetsp:Transcript_27132/g.50626  ORF Transcript_27132/g.50626 Transcript_27132/m.50626 type:complete len:202 (+) Transcript_27132:215-820(+)
MRKAMHRCGRPRTASRSKCRTRSIHGKWTRRCLWTLAHPKPRRPRRGRRARPPRSRGPTYLAFCTCCRPMGACSSRKPASCPRRSCRLMSSSDGCTGGSIDSESRWKGVRSSRRRPAGYRSVGPSPRRLNQSWVLVPPRGSSTRPPATPSFTRSTSRVPPPRPSSGASRISRPAATPTPPGSCSGARRAAEKWPSTSSARS